MGRLRDIFHIFIVLISISNIFCLNRVWQNWGFSARILFLEACYILTHYILWLLWILSVIKITTFTECAWILRLFAAYWIELLLAWWVLVVVLFNSRWGLGRPCWRSVRALALSWLADQTALIRGRIVITWQDWILWHVLGILQDLREVIFTSILLRCVIVEILARWHSLWWRQIIGCFRQLLISQRIQRWRSLSLCLLPFIVEVGLSTSWTTTIRVWGRRTLLWRIRSVILLTTWSICALFVRGCNIRWPA